MKVRIVSDGKGMNTRVELEDGTVIPNVRSATWKCDAGGFATATIELANVGVDVLAELKETIRPYRIEDITALGDDSRKYALLMGGK